MFYPSTNRQLREKNWKLSVLWVTIYYLRNGPIRKLYLILSELETERQLKVWGYSDGATIRTVKVVKLFRQDLPALAEGKQRASTVTTVRVGLRWNSRWNSGPEKTSIKCHFIVNTRFQIGYQIPDSRFKSGIWNRIWYFLYTQIRDSISGTFTNLRYG